MRSNLKNAPRDPIFCIHTHMISPMNIGYEILTPEVIRGHWRSQEVKMRSNLKNALRDPIFGMHTHVISLTYTGNGILTLKLIRGQQRSK